MNSIREKSKSWTYKRGFIEGAHKILLFSKHASKFESSVIDFLVETKYPTEHYFDYNWNLDKLIEEKKDEAIEINEVGINAADGTVVSNKVIRKKYNFDTEMLPFEKLLLHRIFMTERIENIQKVLKSNNLINEDEAFLLENTKISLPDSEESKKELAEKIYTELEKNQYLWYTIYQKAQTEYQKMDYLRGKWFSNGITEQKTILLKKLLEDEEEIEGFTNLTDYLNSLMTVKYVLE